MRILLNVLRNPKHAVHRVKSVQAVVWQSAKTDGWPATLHKVKAKVLQRLGLLPVRGSVRYELTRGAAQAPARLALRVLLIAETSLPQCFKYRVLQKQRMIEGLGYECTVVSWREPAECMQFLQSHSVVIFYRTPHFPEVKQMISEAQALGIPTFWEVDDLIFDSEKYATNANLKDLSRSEMRHLLSDAELYRQAMVACDAAIASTSALAAAMLGAGARRAYVVENALDEDTLRIARVIKQRSIKPDDGKVRIVYGSGTRTHDSDFRQIAPAIINVLERHENACLRIVGHLNLPENFGPYEDRIERFPLSDYPTYLNILAQCDINIAPLENSVFSDAKSNIKFLEGAVVGLPSVCSPRSAFKAAITHGVNGFLADGVEAWKDALDLLVRSPELRSEMGMKAYARATEGYAHTTIAQTQVLPILQALECKRPGLRVLAVNVFFAPRSFGGATVVAEEMSSALNDRADVDYFVFTSVPTQQAGPYQVVRYDAKGAVVFGMGLPHEVDRALDYDNPYALTAFTEALRAVKPHVVHMHSIQGIGAGIADVCQAEGIPYVVTLHDAWWICARQFMITPANRYCHQTTIDLDVCGALCTSRTENEPRQSRLHEVLQGADLLLSPSAFFREIYVANGFDPERVVVNKNGVRPPKRPRARPIRERPFVRFGYVGGDSHIKGAHLLKKYFSTVSSTDYELVVVDNTLNLGMRSINAKLWACTGKLTVRQAYTQETIDEFFDEIDVLLFPTQWKESFGLTVREALIRDVWVVATDAGGVVEDIVDGENGNIVPFDDDGTELGAVLTSILEDPAWLSGYVNPYKDRIRTIAKQADELRMYLQRVAQVEPVEPVSGVEPSQILPRGGS